MFFPRINLLATIYFCFKMLPFRQAVRLPVVFYNRVRFVNCRGNVSFLSDVVRFKMVQVGAHGSDMFSNLRTTIDLRGGVVFKGDGIRIGYGSLLRVEEGGVIEFAEGSIIGARNMVFCCKSIRFDQNCLFSWDCQILDSDTHSLRDLTTGEINPKTQSIIIGKDCWIGNHVIINKGTVLPEGTIVSSMSLLNKDYSAFINENSIIGGIPAKLLKEHIVRVNDKL